MRYAFAVGTVALFGAFAPALAQPPSTTDWTKPVVGVDAPLAGSEADQTQPVPVDITVEHYAGDYGGPDRGLQAAAQEALEQISRQFLDTPLPPPCEPPVTKTPGIKPPPPCPPPSR